MTKFLVKLKATHDASGLTAYRVAEETGLSHATVRRYATSNAEVDTIQQAVIILAKFYGVNWRSPEIIEVIAEDPEKLNSTPEAA